jgi:hypothetical protein
MHKQAMEDTGKETETLSDAYSPAKGVGKVESAGPCRSDPGTGCSHDTSTNGSESIVTKHDSLIRTVVNLVVLVFALEAIMYLWVNL